MGIGGGGGSEKRHNDVSRSKYRYVTLPLQSAEEKKGKLSFEGLTETGWYIWHLFNREEGV